MKERYANIEEAMAWTNSARALIAIAMEKDLDEGAVSQKMDEALCALISASYALMMAKHS